MILFFQIKYFIDLTRYFVVANYTVFLHGVLQDDGLWICKSSSGCWARQIFLCHLSFQIFTTLILSVKNTKLQSWNSVEEGKFWMNWTFSSTDFDPKSLRKGRSAEDICKFCCLLFLPFVQIIKTDMKD